MQHKSRSVSFLDALRGLKKSAGESKIVQAPLTISKGSRMMCTNLSEWGGRAKAAPYGTKALPGAPRPLSTRARVHSLAGGRLSLEASRVASTSSWYLKNIFDK